MLLNDFIDRTEIKKSNRLFSDKEIWALLIPIILEQLLNSLMGMLDTMMVSRIDLGASMSAVSLVDSINNLFIQLFSAMAAGAAIVCSQYIGKKDIEGANKAAKQVIFTMFFTSTVVMILLLIFRVPLLNLTFGRTEKDVWNYSQQYFLITTCSYPFIALFNAGGSLYRACGNSKFPMKISIIANIINVIGNAVLIFVFHLGVSGAAIATLVSRAFSAVVILYCLRKSREEIKVKGYLKIRPQWVIISIILAIGIPSGIENSMFQFGKLAIQSTVSEMGTIAIAAQAMTSIFENVNGVGGTGVGIGLMTIIGHCLGAGRKEEAKLYMIKLIGIGELVITLSCIFVYIIAKPVTILAGMSGESASLCLSMLGYITIFKPLFWTLSFVIPYGLRAAGDVRFSMIVSTITMWFVRVSLCIFLVKVFHFGPMAVWIGMFSDWFVRGVIFTKRMLGQKWLKKNVI